MGYPLTYLYLACFVAMVVAGTAIWLTVPPQPARKWLLLTPLCVGAWTFSDFLSNLATEPATLRSIGLMFAPFWMPIPFLVLWTAIHYSLPETSRWRRPAAGLLLFSPVPACLALAYSSSLHSRVAPAWENGLYFVPQATPWHLVPIAYFLVAVGGSAWTLHRAAQRTGAPVVKAMSHFFVRGMIPASLIAALANGGLSLFGLSPPHIGSVMAAVLLGFVAVGVATRGFFQPVYEVLRDRDQALASLSRREELLTAMPFGVGIVDISDFSLVFRNAPFEALVPPSWENALLGEVRARASRNPGPSGDLIRTEIILEPDAAPARVLQVSSVPFSYGGREACLLSVRDISRERSLEERLRQAEQLKALGTLAGGIAHDMNNILSVIMLLADGIDASGPNPEPVNKAAQRIVGACRRGRDLTSNILAFTHQRKPQWSPVSVPALIQATLEQIRPSLPAQVALEVSFEQDLPGVLGDETQLQQALVNLCRNAVEAMPKGGRLLVLGDRVRSPHPRPPVPAGSRTPDWLVPGALVPGALVPGAPVPGALEPGALKGVGPLSGSTFFPGVQSSEAPTSPDAGLALGLAGSHATADSAPQSKEQLLRLRIEDTGEGMDEATRRRCVEPLFTTKPIGRGTGLGLAVVLSTVSRHGGSMLVESEPGKGTRMTILLPVPQGTRQELTPEVKRPSSSPSLKLPVGAPPPAVLLVDDEEELRGLAREELEALGCRVVEAADGFEALRLHLEESGTVDVVILDLVMPGLDGAETFHKLREREPELPVVLMSGYGHEADVEKLLSEGACYFLAKPFDRKTLAARVQRAMTGRPEVAGAPASPADPGGTQ